MAQATDSCEPIPCIYCKYDLRATSVLANCPECGKPVEYTKLGYRVEGEYLVSRYGARVPQRCALTSQPLYLPDANGRTIDALGSQRGSEVRIQFGATRRRQAVMYAAYVVWVAGFAAAMEWLFHRQDLVAKGGLTVVLLVFTLPALIGGYVVRAWCQRNWKPRPHSLYLVRRLATRRASRTLGAQLVGAIVVFLPMLVWSAAYDRFDLLAFSLAPLCCISLPIAFIAVDQFPVVRSVNSESWIAGCCPAYLAFCAAERERLLDEARKASHAQPDDAICEVDNVATAR